ncbi:MAG: thioesterase family protein [Rhodobacteraceae bacterium]|jgi:acyl-CoA thioester hydrolase|nr:thioesterase family protein [Paracoccaceae bacterium]
MPAAEGHETFLGQVRKEWIDVNGHMNVTAYDTVFAAAEAALYAAAGFTDDYPMAAGRSFFRVEKHVRYEAELLAGAAIRVATRVLRADGRRFHVFHALVDVGRDRRAATMEVLALHVDLATRRVVPLADPLQAAAWAGLAGAHAGLPPPAGVGRRIAP